MIDRKYVHFSINDYDRDGEINEKRLYLHIGEYMRLTFKDLADLKLFRDQIGTCIREIEENYDDEGVTAR